jgi:ABC-type branched-subunit amino acid transport system substrate-binding protein
MPRYQLSRQDLDDLLVYLKTLGSDRDPGVTDEALRVGVLLAPASRSADAGEPVREALSAFFDRLNERGGIYGRRVELRFAEVPERPQDRARALAAFLDAEPVLALLSPFAAGAEAEFAEEAGRRRLPAVGPLTPAPRPDVPGGRYVFYLDAGVEGQARALVRFAAGGKARPLPAVALLWREGPELLPVVEAVREECRLTGCGELQEVLVPSRGADPDRIVARLREGGGAAVIGLGVGDEAGRLLDSAAAIGWEPDFLLPGSLAGRGVFDPHPGFGGRIHLALPSLPTDQTPEAAEEYRQFAARRPLAARQRATHWSALAGARLLAEGLRRSGRNATRERLVETLESLRDFRTGYCPPLTFGPRRRVGAWGAYVIGVSPPTGRPEPAGEWQDLHRP